MGKSIKEYYKVSMQNYYIIEIKNPLLIKDWEEIEALAFLKFESTGVEDFSLEEEKVDEILGERSYSGADIPLSVIEEVEETISHEDLISKKVYFSNKEDALNFQSYLNEDLKIDSLFHEVLTQDWNEEWRKNFKPIQINSNFEIVPSWEKETYRSPTEKKLYIYPGMGFGTGNHETTFLCLDLVLKTNNIENYKTCLDFGCGSGILGLALRLFNQDIRLDLYDIEKEALDNCVQNIDLNQIKKENINLLLPDSRNNFLKKYNIVFANILKNVLELEKDNLVNYVEENGYLILSGLLKGQEESIIEQYKAAQRKLEVIEVANKGDWVAILMQMK